MINLFENQCFKKMLMTSVVVVFLIFLGTMQVYADCSEGFSWLPNTEPNIKGYKIYYGYDQGGPYSESVYVGKPEPVDGRIKATVNGLICGHEYYFVGVAVNNYGRESEYSENEVYLVAGEGEPGRVNGLMISE